MKKLILILLTVFTSLTIYSQDITGQWNGILKVQGIQLRLVFNITKNENGFSATMDSPDQGAKGIPVTTTAFENSKLKLEVANARIEYNGELKEKAIIGTFMQNGQSFPMDLSREKTEKKVLVRPQEPSKPYSYYSEEINFENKKDKIVLAGTLTLPKKGGNYPVVILISGSGPQNRDEELMGHKPFLVISDYFTKNGIAVLRYDDRGVAQSKGDFKTATSLDFASDVESAIAYLKTRKEINKNKIGLVGHSEGGIIAPMVASKSKDVNCIVLLAGTGIPGDQLLLLQQELMSRASGVSEVDIQNSIASMKRAVGIISKSTNSEQLKIELTEYIKAANSKGPEEIGKISKDDYIKSQVDQMTSPWNQYFIKYNPATALEKVKCPVLAVNGEKDLQVPPKENLTAIKNALEKGGNKKVTIKEFPNLNHLFQECKTGSPNEYAEIEQTFSPTALDEITKWILNQNKNSRQ
ncbi:alpha/beta fold hydrolase [Flavobacterium rhamnosiphilum]|uniref:Alpha/beta fold hydrolase n=1 Tax=Flavobacterium rhamnosiphilum TaxID=2541724 RepID=A0A4R5FBP6_9FLAO|nr:alpha/beta fold hydrolase [Flavobacterium rhamnosiphilum]TDE45999.1 alpha/beta fold hydrolase [Flavobacterium rhamnosiphilum]